MVSPEGLEKEDFHPFDPTSPPPSPPGGERALVGSKVPRHRKWEPPSRSQSAGHFARIMVGASIAAMVVLTLVYFLVLPRSEETEMQRYLRGFAAFRNAVRPKPSETPRLEDLRAKLDEATRGGIPAEPDAKMLVQSAQDLLTRLASAQKDEPGRELASLLAASKEAETWWRFHDALCVKYDLPQATEYIDTRNEVAITPPIGWKIDDRSQPGTLALLGPAEHGCTPMVLVFWHLAPGRMESYLKEHKPRVEAESPDGNVQWLKDEETEKIDGCPTQRLEYLCDWQAGDDGSTVKVHALQFVIEDQPRFYLITCFVAADVFDRYKTILDATARTFRRVPNTTPLPAILLPEPFTRPSENPATPAAPGSGSPP
jgi:hypothetical protein